MESQKLQLTQSPVAKKGMLIRRPPAEVFRAFTDPAVTTKFWFTRSSGKIAPNARVQWDWEMFGASTKVTVKEFKENSRFLFEWGPDASPTTVELRFVPGKDDSTYVQVTESGYSGPADQMVAHAIDSAAGFALVLAAAKALLEHDIVLKVVLDHAPIGIEL